MTELALPAGSLTTALTAFRNGADAVYFGLREFSARKGAVNFSVEDLSKIRRYALDNGKKIYVTVNTLIDDSSVKRAAEMLDTLSFYGNDGLIIQDLGLVDIIRKYYPEIRMHGSTQLAVHTVEGVREMRDLGFERVVLSRELNLSEIAAIRKACPETELKVFIHGALCYGFSGLCSASYLKCGRSANGGECAQICRSWFRNIEDGTDGYYFSMKDNAVRKELRLLSAMGIDSVKVEGRLKSPEYTAAAARYYRAVLDGREPSEEDEEALFTTFLRKSSSGYLHYGKGRESLVCTSWPGHLGLDMGRITEQRGSSCLLETERNLENHDGIQYFMEDSSGLDVPIKLPAVVKGRARNGYILRIEDKQSLLGKEIYKISDSTKREKTPSDNIPLFRKKTDITISLFPDRIEASILGKTIAKEAKAGSSEKKSDFEKTLRELFSQSGSSPYTAGNLTFINHSGFASPFVQPSLLKEFRRLVYSSFPFPLILSTHIGEPQRKGNSFMLPKRSLLDKDLPWSLEGTEIGERTYFTFPPVTFNEDKLWTDMLNAVRGKRNVTIGLNNISQVRFAKEHPEFDYFADIFLYLSNRYALSLLTDEIPSLKAGYLWFERNECSGVWPFEPTASSYEPPFFISRSCFRHDSLGESCRGCPGRGDYLVSQGEEKYSIKVRDCLTVMKREPHE